jgi:thymidine phosphorylase
VVKEAGCAIIGQTADLAPADGKLYAVRDVTATVDSIPLITASILSKKLAAGLQTLVLDVKVGNGAFMAAQRTPSGWPASLVEVANGAGVKTSALITDMNEPLADAAGNAVEIATASPSCAGEKTGTRLEDGGAGLCRRNADPRGLASQPAGGRARLARRRICSGKAALEIFGRMVHMLGGPADLLERPQAYLVGAGHSRPLPKRRGRLSVNPAMPAMSAWL